MPEQAHLDVLAANRSDDPWDSLPAATVADIELQASCTPAEVRETYRQWGCCVIRGLLAGHDQGP